MRRRPWYSPLSRHVAVLHLQHRVARDERGRVSVGAEPELHEVELQRPAAVPLEQSLVAGGRRFEVGSLDRHGEQAAPRAAVRRATRISSRRVRLRRASPRGAMRSSTCATQVRSQGRSMARRARSISHGVSPPLNGDQRMAAFARGVAGTAAAISTAAHARGGLADRRADFRRTAASPFAGGSYQPP